MTDPHSTPAGRRVELDRRPHAVLTRVFAAPIEVVWAAVSDSERMARWIGVYDGDPADGQIRFRMTAEGDDVAEERYAVERCDPPRGYVVRSLDPQPWNEHPTSEEVPVTWRLTVELVEDDRRTTLTLAQDLGHESVGRQAGEVAANVGPGWEYYLDRLGAHLAGGDPTRIAFDGYEAIHSEHYRALFTEPR